MDGNGDIRRINDNVLIVAQNIYLADSITTNTLLNTMDALVNNFEQLTREPKRIGKEFKCKPLKILPLGIHMQKNSISSEAVTQMPLLPNLKAETIRKRRRRGLMP